MIDALDDLLDDRAFVEIVGDEVRSRADQLHAARMRLVIRLRALEAGQERMVDVDRAVRELRARLLRQYLHIAREDHELGAARLEEVEPLRFLLRLRIGRDREVAERQPVLHRERLEVGMVRHDADDIHLQFAHPPAEQQVREAVLELRHHDQHLRPCVHVMDRPLRVAFTAAEHGRDRREFLAQRIDLQRFIRWMKDAAHEEAVAEIVVEHVQRIDIAAMAIEKADDGGDLAGRARARQCQDELIGAVLGGHETPRMAWAHGRGAAPAGAPPGPAWPEPSLGPPRLGPGPSSGPAQKCVKHT